MKRLLQAIGPAIVVAAVVLGPGSILTSSKVGASLGLLGLPVIALATVLMIGMVLLAARLGVVYEKSIGVELRNRLGAATAIFIGGVLFTLVALFQSSNNSALVGGVEPLLGNGEMSFGKRLTVLIAANAIVLAILYLMKDAYKTIERCMKVLVALMAAAFAVNLIVAITQPVEKTQAAIPDVDWFALLGLIGTTFSVAGAFYQAYLVKEKGWNISDAKNGVFDAVCSISLLGIVTSMVLLTSYFVFYGRTGIELKSVGDVAVQLEPTFGASARIVFASGILAGAVSSFLVNALIGGTVMSDCLGLGSKLTDRWPVHLTAAALIIGMLVSVAAMIQEGSTVMLITFAQALTVAGVPALALALIYLGTRRELKGERAIPKPVLGLAIVGFAVACLLAILTAQKVASKVWPADPPAASASARA